MRDGQALWDALAARDTAELTRLLDSGLSSDRTDEWGRPILAVALDSDDVELVRPFLDSGTPVDMVTTERGTTPLMIAAMNGNPSLVEFLISRGANVNLRETGDFDTGTSLTHAVESDEPAAIVPLLLSAGADPDLPRPDGWTPLVLAAYFGHTEVVRALLAAGASTAPSIHDGTVNALGVAEERGHATIARLLRDHGAPQPAEPHMEHLAAALADITTWCATHAAPLGRAPHDRGRIAGAPRTTAGMTANPTVEADDLGALTARLQTLVSDITDWLAGHAAPAHAQLTASLGPAGPDAVTKLEDAVGEFLTADFRAYLRLFGGHAGLGVFEYEGLSVAGMMERRRSLEQLRETGTFDTWPPRELDPERARVRFAWWHPGWVPFAADGGGNLWCIDLAPPEHGTRGQVFAWEEHAGPLNPRASSFERFLSDYRDELLSGRHAYDPDSGTYF
ncbi:ankyrin repeat domain-containing protein [Yinghuangia seranimata]|uniref:ankyrin repeat domain-containing protein n=1 Tax=Yinghuangia seranimata TaxID=408067 RepID=UPI00248D0360|nr:ankyrin repeat domain-containing protein [Yinghuangia seranimata]MDI2127608.1 ankyrin repeat domain-containing protein [Yinghuangia seranimata]